MSVRSNRGPLAHLPGKSKRLAQLRGNHSPTYPAKTTLFAGRQIETPRSTPRKSLAISANKSVRQQGAAVLHKHLAQHLRAVPLEMTHETVHRILTALMVREVAGVAENILETRPLVIRGDRL